MAKTAAPAKKKVATTTTTQPNLAGILGSGPSLGTAGATGTGLSSGAPGDINIAKVPSQYQLDPSIANEVMVGGPTGVPATTGEGVATRNGQQVAVAGKVPPVQATAERLLLAYSHLFGGDPGKEMTQQDTALLDGLDKKGNQGIAGMIKQVTTPGMGGAKGGGTVDRGNSGFDAQGQYVLNEWDQIFGGGKTQPINMNKVKGELAKEITKKIPGLTTEDITKADPKNILQLPVTSQLSEELQKQGIYLQPGQPISAAAERLGKSDSQIASAAAAPGPLTAQKQYSQLIAGYDSASAVDKANKVKQLTDAGLILNPNNITEDDVAKAYKTLVTKAVTDKTSVQLAQQNLISDDKKNLNLGVAETSQQAAEVANTADRLGVNLTPQEQDYLSNTATTQAWSQAQITQAVGGAFKVPTDSSGAVDVSQLSGEAASIYQGYQKIADEYQVPISSGSIGKFTAQALQSSISGINDSGGIDTGASLSSGTSAASAAFQQYIQSQAEQLYPTFAPQIAGGATTKTLLEPYAEVAAALLGNGTASGTGASAAQAQDAVTALGINWSQPKWAVALQGGTNQANGGPAPMTLDAWRHTLIMDPQYGWAKTDDAKNAGMGVADHLLGIFGQPAATGQGL